MASAPPAELVEDQEAEELTEKTAVKFVKSMFAVSDSVIAPKPFTGKTGDTDAESWLEFFELYCKHRNLTPTDRLTLFPLMMREGAADWLATLSGHALTSYKGLVKAFQDNYFVPSELRWKETGSLWNQAQRSDERVEDFIARVRRGARRLSMSEIDLAGIIVHGLRPAIRMHVLQNGGSDLNDLIKTARLAEAVAPPVSDNSTALLMEVMKASIQANEKQAKEIRALTNKVSALAVIPDHETVNMLEDARPREVRPTERRPFRQTPQMQQRNNYARNFSTRTPEGGAAGFQGNNGAQAGAECSQCGWTHPVGRCRAVGQACRICDRIGHFARVCRTVRQQRN